MSYVRDRAHRGSRRLAQVLVVMAAFPIDYPLKWTAANSLRLD